MPFSHHSHSGQFCSHAKNTLEEMVQQAISCGMSTFALTEHMPRDGEDLYPEEIEAAQTEAGLVKLFDDYWDEAVRLREKYKSQINILIGFECEWIRGSSRGLVETALNKHKFDFFMGSIHHVHSVPIDFDHELYWKARATSGGSDEALFEDFFDEQYDMLQALKPLIVGHFDLIRLKSDDPERSFTGMENVWRKINRNLEFIASYGGMLELNSSSFRKGMSEPYPKVEICQVFLRLGGRFTLSDDSHGIEQVGLNYGRVLESAQKAGIEQLYFLQQSEERSDPRFSVALKSMSIYEIKDHPFTKHLKAQKQPDPQPYTLIVPRA